VLAVQGDFAAHLASLERLGLEPVEVRTPAELSGLDGVILPGGESGAHVRILRENGLWDALRDFHAAGGALYGTCAGLILLARGVTNPAQESLGLLDVDVIRNGYGRQIDSFEADVDAAALGAVAPLRLVFIRAPRIGRVGTDVEVLLSHDGEPVAVRQGRVLASTFHPEMTDDPAMHRFFLERVAGGRRPAARR
jgi:5'-phosphate synthase pdxT subunit